MRKKKNEKSLPPPDFEDQKAARGRWDACTAGICKSMRKSQRSEALEDGTDAGLQARSLRSAESGMHQAFLMNRSGAHSEGLSDI